MVLGKGPKIAPRSEDIPLYASAPINQLVNIKSYIGQPLINEDGSLFGTLCAIDPLPKSENIAQDIIMIELFGDLLSKILQADLRQNQQIRLHERLQLEASSDVLTGLYNRRAWERLLITEEERCKHYGVSAAIFFIDINDLKKVNDNLGHVAGDQIIRQAANVLRNNLRSNDIVARLGGDEFVVLSVETNQDEAEILFKRLMAAFKEVQISIAIGFAIRHPSQGLVEAAAQADQNMYIHKRQMKMLSL